MVPDNDKWATATRVALWLLEKVKIETDGMSLSIGVGPNKLLARLVSSINKPNGVTVVRPGLSYVRNLLKHTKLLTVPGFMGKLGRQILDTLNLSYDATVDSLSCSKNHKTLMAAFGKEKSKYILERARGIDLGKVISRGPPKSVISERSFPPTTDITKLRRICSLLCDNLLSRLEEDMLENQRLPSKFNVKWRLGYGGNNAGNHPGATVLLCSTDSTGCSSLMSRGTKMPAVVHSLLLSSFEENNAKVDMNSSSSIQNRATTYQQRKRFTLLCQEYSVKNVQKFHNMRSIAQNSLVTTALKMSEKQLQLPGLSFELLNLQISF